MMVTNDNEAVKLTKPGIATIYVNIIRPIVRDATEATIDVKKPFLYINTPSIRPISPVANRNIIISCMLTIIRIKAEDIRTIMPR